MKLKETKDGVVIEVFVKPKQPKFKITIDSDEIVVFATEEPVKGKVNKEIVKEFSRLFEAKVELVSGVTSRQKVLLIGNMSRAQVQNVLEGKMV